MKESERIANLERRLAEAEDALSFYADPENYELSIIRHSRTASWGDPLIEQDGGQLARAVLKKCEGGGA